jgi:hypothetical protein
MATLADVRAWAAGIDAERDRVDSAITLEQASVATARDAIEQRLIAARVGHLRHKAATLRAKARFLAEADTAISANQSHPAASQQAPTSVVEVQSEPRRYAGQIVQ